MGAHVSACPNHQVGRTTPFKMRGDVATAGQFGYEMDLSKLTDEETELAKQQIKRYKELGPVFHRGDCYRLSSPFDRTTSKVYSGAALMNIGFEWLLYNDYESEIVVFDRISD